MSRSWMGDVPGWQACDEKLRNKIMRHRGQVDHNNMLNKKDYSTFLLTPVKIWYQVRIIELSGLVRPQKS